MSSVYSSYIKRMRMCANGNCKGCTYQYEGLTNTEECKEDLLYDAAEQLQDADKCNARLLKKCKEMEKRIAELQAQLPKRGEWIDSKERMRPDMCSVCGCVYEADRFMDKIAWNYCPNCGAKMEVQDG